MGGEKEWLWDRWVEWGWGMGGWVVRCWVDLWRGVGLWESDKGESMMEGFWG